MSMTATINDQWSDGKRLHVIGTIAFSGNYAANGDTVDLIAAGVEAGSAPLRMTVESPDGYATHVTLGTDPSNNKVQLFSAANTEVAAGAMPAGVVAVTSQFEAIFNQLM